MSFPDNHSGTGCVLIWTTSSYTASFDEITPEFYTRGVINTTSMSDTCQKKIPEDQPNAGKASIKIHFVPGNPPPYTATNETFTIVYPATGTGTYTAYTNRYRDAVDSFVTSYKPKLIKNGLMTADIEIEFSGLITSSAGA